MISNDSILLVLLGALIPIILSVPLKTYRWLKAKQKPLVKSNFESVKLEDNIVTGFLENKNKNSAIVKLTAQALNSTGKLELGHQQFSIDGNSIKEFKLQINRWPKEKCDMYIIMQYSQSLKKWTEEEPIYHWQLIPFW